MTIALAILGWIIFGLAVVAGLVLDLLGLFGNWIILVAAVLAWVFSGFAYFGPLALAAMLLLALVGEALEFILAGLGARKFGGSKGSMVAALVGCLGGAVLGTPLFPVIGTLVGACLGAFAAAAFYEYVQQEKAVDAALWTGLGAALGKVGGMMAKFCCGLAMIAIMAATLIW